MEFRDFDETLEMLLEQRALIKKVPDDAFKPNTSRGDKLREIDKLIEKFLVTIDDE